MKTVVSIFPQRQAAESAVNDLREQGFDRDISILAKNDEGSNNLTDQSPDLGGDSVMDGTSTGGAIGGLAGLALGAGALTIPGIGPLVAAGPIAGMLSGAATGGITGGLVDWGIPQNRGEFFENQVKQGNIMVSVRTDQNNINRAANTLRRHGAQDVEVH